MNILFTNAGRRTYIIDFMIDIIKEGYDINIFISDTSVNNASMYISEKTKIILTPYVSHNEQSYIDTLLRECLINKIDIIIPLMDFELPILAENKDKFLKNNIEILVSDDNVIRYCLDKKSNYFFCLKNNIPVPQTWFQKIITNKKLIKKKILGSGSEGLEVIKPNSDYEFVEGVDMVQEYIEGIEFGMDILNDTKGRYVHSCFREKILMRAGETDKARTFFNNEFEKEAIKISSCIQHIGNLDVDFIQSIDKKYYYIDFNPRFGGGYPFSHLSGANYLKYIVELLLNKKPKTPEFKRSISAFKGIKVYYY